MKTLLGYIPDNAIEPCVAISEMSITYTQEADTNSNRDESQFLKVTAANNGAGEDGFYFNISTEGCDHWSIDNPDDLTEIIKDFSDRLNLNITKEKDVKTYKRKDTE